MDPLKHSDHYSTTTRREKHEGRDVDRSMNRDARLLFAEPPLRAWMYITYENAALDALLCNT
jgi:hypothetical protein